MPDLMAIVSRSVFDEASTEQPAPLDVGGIWPTDGYRSTSPTLRKLEGDGALFLVTVRPPEERLWLVAILERPQLGEDGWSAKPNKAPIADITHLLSRLVLQSGKGVTVIPGKLGMSLQSPRALAAADVALLRAASDAAAGKTAATPSSIDEGADHRRKLLAMIADKTKSHTFYSANGMPQAPLPSVSLSRIQAVERAIGAPLPTFFKELYTQVGDGVWPGTLSLSAILSEHEVNSLSSRVWPAACIPFYDWGCNIVSYLDLKRAKARVVRFDPHFSETRAPGADQPFDPTLVPAFPARLVGGAPMTVRKESECLEDWFDAWLEGHTASVLQGMEPQAWRRAEREVARSSPRARR